MSEDTKGTEVAEQVEASEQEVQLSPVQQKALDQGWKPKDQFEGAEEEFIDAPEFVRRGELFGKIDHQSRELKAVKQALEALRQHNTKIEQSAFDRAVKELKAQRKEAIIDGDTSKAFELEEKIEDAQEERARIARQAAVPAVQEVDPNFVRWVESNSWYTKDMAMQAVADRVGTELHGRGVSQSEVLKAVADAVRKEFPHKFANTKAERPGAVEAPARGGTSVQRSDLALSEDERNIMRKIVRTGVMTEKQYMEQLKKAG